jgi:hypothetical protein
MSIASSWTFDVQPRSEGVVTSLTAAAPIRVDAGDPPPRLAGVGQPQIALVLRETDGRPVAEGRVDVPGPQVRGLDDVDVAVEDLELAVGHGSPPWTPAP